MAQIIAQAKDFIHRHKKWEPLVFFVAGFTFDLLLLHRIDDPLMLTHQAIYLVFSALLIAWDLFADAGKVTIPKWLTKMWSYREGLLHFLLGTLLNVYTIFYFKSGTILSSLVFLLLLATLLYLNEVRPSRISKHVLRNALFALCLLSYMGILVPIGIGAIGDLVFFGAVAVACGLFLLFIRFLSKRLEPAQISREIRLPFLVVTLVYTFLYIFKVLPPVPLSIKHMGIYHEITKEDGQYRLGYARSPWRFWESGDQTFEALPGDKIYCFIQVFSPTRFKDQLFVRWQYYDPKNGWLSADAIPLSVVGGRDEGYRGYTLKGNYQPGDWRVAVETTDGRVIGRISLTVAQADPSSSTREMKYELR